MAQQRAVPFDLSMVERHGARRPDVRMQWLRAGAARRPLVASVSVVRIDPAARQGLAGEELQVSFFIGSGLWQFLADVIAAGDLVAKGVEQIIEAQYFNEMTGGAFFQKHV